MKLPRYPKYKESGVKWLGKIPEHWDLCRVKTLFEIKKRIAGDEGYDVLSITQRGLQVRDIESNEGQLAADYSKYQFVKPGDFAMNHMDLLTGYIDISNTLGVTSPDYRVFSTRPTANIHDRYFLHLFQHAYRGKILYAFGQGASHLGRWRLPTDQFNNFVFPLPLKAEQLAICSLVDHETEKINALIEEQQHLIELLTEKRQAIISHAVTKGLNSDAQMKNSGIEFLGKVPKHWVVTSIRRVIRRIEQGWSPECIARPAEPEEWGVVKSGCVNRGIFVEEENKALPDMLQPMPEYEIHSGDVLMSRASGSPELVGSTAYVKATRPHLMLSDKTFRIHLERNFDPEFFVAVFNSKVMRFQIERAISGAEGLANNIPQSSVKGFYTARPPLEEQRAIVEYLSKQCSSMDALIIAARDSIELMQERRAALICVAVTGQIDVRSFQPEEAAAVCQ